ncbi:hypothetical protein [Pelagibius sp.]|uniref:hypothetical protein n=1 Tax=Pelagibius sp. TaxID=1931238 RepID=UPI00261B6491|nr:hypothetical protein [Pelagibius sp.]
MKPWMLAAALAVTFSLFVLPQSGKADPGGGWISNGTTLTGLEGSRGESASPSGPTTVRTGAQ